MGEQRGTAEQLKGNLNNQQSLGLTRSLDAFNQASADERQQRYDFYSNIKTKFDGNGNATRGRYVDVAREGRTVRVEWSGNFSDWAGHIGVSANEALRKTDFDVYQSAVNAAFKTEGVTSFTINGAWRPSFDDYKAAYEVMKSQGSAGVTLKAMSSVIDKYRSHPWSIQHVTSRAIDINQVENVNIINTVYTNKGPKLMEPDIVREFTDNLINETNSRQLFQPWRMWVDTHGKFRVNLNSTSIETRHKDHLHFGATPNE